MSLIFAHSVHHDNQAFDVYSKIEFPIAAKKNFGNSHLRVVGTCDGPICLADDIPSYANMLTTFVIWNPTIRKFVTLPRPGITFLSHGRNNASLGFGFDAMTNDYKVARLVTLLEEDEQPTLAEVYSLATGTCSNLDCVSPASLITKTEADEEEALTEPSKVEIGFDLKIMTFGVLVAPSYWYSAEIIQDILFRLPVKSLINCTSVCKAWRSMIMNKSFIRAHLSLTVDVANQDDIDLLLLHIISCNRTRTYGHKTIISEIKDEVHSVHYDNHAFDVYSQIEFQLLQSKNCAILIFMWSALVAGCATCNFTTEDDRPTVAEVYSLATGTWRSLGCVSPACGTNGAASNAFVNGVLHWPVVGYTNGDSRYFILTFDLGKEVFGKIPIPKIIHWNPKWGLQLSVSDNKKSIALFMRPNNREDFYMDYGHEESVLDMWVMKEYGREESWTKLITLNPQGPETIFLGTLCFRKSGEVLLLLKEKERQELVSLDLVSKQFKLLGISGYKYCTGHFYKESLLLLDKSNAESY
ncbi:uncharacterized protein LOC110763652 [Prunus avium]|uniref:Uncharacterized protein LOC110763652 n=1 Tax=Prunus avium TaxID=42229 RepID=A0A6P5T4T1_PRUAV|nr:uncharacterized protein LOC110763652 [Prunus avium]